MRSTSLNTHNISEASVNKSELVDSIAEGAGLSKAERTRARSIHLDARPDHVTVAFVKD